MFAIRAEVLAELVEDEEWCRRLEKAESMSDVENVVEAFVRQRGYRCRRFQKK